MIIQRLQAPCLEDSIGLSIREKYYPESPLPDVYPCLHNKATNSTTDDLLAAFWKTEEAPSELSHYSDEEQLALEHFNTTHSRNSEGRYVVHLPLKSVLFIKVAPVVRLADDSTRTSTHCNTREGMMTTSRRCKSMLGLDTPSQCQQGNSANLNQQPIISHLME